MKYWHQLSNVEDAIFQVRKIRSQLSVMMDSELIASSNTDQFPETYKDFLYDLSERFENAMSTLSVEFQNLWDVIRNDSFDSSEKEKTDLSNDRWTHIVNDLQKWNEQSMNETSKMSEGIDLTGCAAQPTLTIFDDVTSFNISLTEENLIKNPMNPDEDFDLAWNEAYKKQSDRQ